MAKKKIWFQKLWVKGFEQHGDRYNKRLHRRRPNLINLCYRYIIEIDGSLKSKKDKKKDAFYVSCGFEVFRIKHNDEAMLKEVAKKVNALVQFKDCLWAKGPTAVSRVSI